MPAMASLVEDSRSHDPVLAVNAPLDCLVEALHALQPGFWHSSPPRRNHSTEPSTAALRFVLAGLTAVLSPQHFASSWLDLQEAGADEATLDFHLGQTLAGSLRVLRQQMLCELSSPHSPELEPLPGVDQEAQATQMILEFAKRLPILQGRLIGALQSVPSDTQTIIGHCLVQELTELGVPVVVRVLAQLVTDDAGTDIQPAAGNGDQVFIEPSVEVLIRGRRFIEITEN